MTRIDLSPLYRSSIGFDRFANLLDHAMNLDNQSGTWPPYNIEVTGEDRYSITLALAGFAEDDLDLEVQKGVLTVRGKKSAADESRKFLHQGIASRAFERKFNLADHIEVVGAELKNGLLVVNLKREVPEAARPKKIAVNGKVATQIEQKSDAA